MGNFYRIISLLAFIIMLPIAIQAQNPIPNPGFEAWTSGSPDGWYVNNLLSLATPLTQSSDAHSGSSALRGEVVQFSGSPYPPQFWVGTLSNTFFPITQAYAQLTGYYKFFPVGADTFVVNINIFDANQMPLGSGVIALGAASSYTMFTVDIQYHTQGEAAQAALSGVTSAINIGSYFLLDDVQLSGSVGIKNETPGTIPAEFDLQQNYPNPFNPSTTFKFSIPQSEKVQLVVYNQLGQEVARVVDERLASGTYTADWNAENLPSGIYLYRLTAGDYVESKKMLLVK